MSVAACALGVRQPALDAETAAFFAEAKPWAFILFREACVSRAQVQALTASLREAAGRDAVIFIDQEGGRVARLRPPEWPSFPAARAYGDLYAHSREMGVEAAWLGFRLIAAELRAIGVDGDYAPVLDRPINGADPIIGDRAFAREGETIAVLGAAALAGLAAGGVCGCVKHMPGHGRAEADSHLVLPRVATDRMALRADFAPFAALAEAPAAMTAHIVYEGVDPLRPATCSSIVIEDVIRGEIGFDGLLMSDDLDMKAMAAVSEGLAGRAAAALAAGCDVVLQCSGALADMRAVMEGVSPLAGRALTRARAADLFAKRPPQPFDADAGWARFRELLSATGAVA
ncbi:MAG: beta-N-acetylhexosaminidase [Hyphomonadaceae bacterium]